MPKTQAVKAEIVNRKIEAKKMGRPTSYTIELGDYICEEIIEGKSLRTICHPDDMPNISTIFHWQRLYPDFSEQYTYAKKEQAYTNQEDIHKLAHDTIEGKVDPNAARVAGDLLKWSSSKLLPKVFGDKLDLTSDGRALPAPLLGGVTIEPPKEISE